MKKKKDKASNRTYIYDPKAGEKVPAEPNEAFEEGFIQADNDDNLAIEEENQKNNKRALVEEE